MESRVFTTEINDREFAAYRDGVERQRFLDHRWNLLQRELARYLTENLPENQYQLVRVDRQSTTDRVRGTTILRLSLDVGQVTQRPFVDVSVPPPFTTDDAFSLASTLDYIAQRTISGNQPTIRRSHTSGAFSEEDIAERMVRGPLKPATTKTTAAPPPGRHILIDKQHQPA